MKSLLVSVLWPAWEWASDPSLRYFTASYGARLSLRDNLRVREIISSPWYQAHYGLRLLPDQNAKERFSTTAGGWRFATSIGGAGMGEHPDRKIIDDPHTAMQARSAVERESCIHWYGRTVSTRGVARRARTVVIMQRLNEDDLSGHLLAQGGWTHVMFPMRFEAGRADPLDHRTKPGELLWPALFPETKLKSMEAELGSYGVAGQLQQRPAPEGGGLFQSDWFPIVDAPPDGPHVECRGWDVASTEKAGDYTAGVRIRKVGKLFIVMHVDRGQWSSGAVNVNMKNAAIMDGRLCMQREEQEGGSSGKSVVAARGQHLAGFDYRGVPVSGDKIVRAGPFRAQAEQGNVRLLRGEWNRAYLDELCIFPFGKNDDQVDGTSTAFNALTELRVVGQRPASWG